MGLLSTLLATFAASVGASAAAAAARQGVDDVTVIVNVDKVMKMYKCREKYRCCCCWRVRWKVWCRWPRL